jgi:chloride channel 3/4/5
MTVRDVGGFNSPLQSAQFWFLVNLLENKLDEGDVQGYPVISVDGNNLLMGYIGRSEIRFVLGDCIFNYIFRCLLISFVVEQFRRRAPLDPHTLCTFHSHGSSHTPQSTTHLPDESWLTVSRRTHDSLVGVNDGDIELLDPSSMGNVSFEPYMNKVGQIVISFIWIDRSKNRSQTPITVAPQLPLEIVIQLFKRMG